MNRTSSLDPAQRLRLGALLLASGVVALHEIATNPADGLVRGGYVVGFMVVAVAVQLHLWRTE